MADKNLTFNIYNENNEPFHNLVLRKSTFTGVVMSLNDKIEGDIYYKDNSLNFTFKEYIIYKNVKYYLDLGYPPTISQKGIYKDNTELMGMTKYSLSFFHPMIQLYNIPFTDEPVSESESLYKSADTIFYWIGTISDFVLKVNKSLQNTPWTCELQPSFIDDGTQSDVIQFQDNKISDVLKTGYDTFHVPFVIDGYKILFGTPSNEILIENTTTPYVFKMGQGLGLKNNDRTPKNNRVITRLAGYGSEDNIPNGYPKIRWEGDQAWKYTINNSSNEPNSYPIIDGIINGENVKLINHPFTRKYLMPPVFTESVNKKVNPLVTGYNPDISLIDYYDAVDDENHTYSNKINIDSPVYDKKQFETIKPSIINATYNGQRIDLLKSITPCDKEGNVVNTWDDSVDTEGNYNQPYFKIEFYPLGFDLYAMASITRAMTVNMTSGSCNGCKFTLEVDSDVMNLNFYVTQTDGTIVFTPHGTQRDLTIFPDSTNSSITVLVKKDTSTFGILMPNLYQYPITNDSFVFLGIDLPYIYISEKEAELAEAIKNYLLLNNTNYYDYPFEFDNYFLTTYEYILNQIKTNSIIRFEYNNEQLLLSVKEIVIKWGEEPLPVYNITLTDDVTIVLNSIDQIKDDLSKLNSQIASIQYYYGNNFLSEIKNKLSRVNDDIALGNIIFAKNISSSIFTQGWNGRGWRILQSGDSELNSLNVRTNIYLDGKIGTPDFVSGFTGSGWQIDHDAHATFDYLTNRKTMKVYELVYSQIWGLGGSNLITDCNKIKTVVDNGNKSYTCTIDTLDNVMHMNLRNGDSVRIQRSEGLNIRYLIGKISNITSTSFDMLITDGEDIPISGDVAFRVGNESDKSRQGLIYLTSSDDYASYIDILDGVTDGSFAGKTKVRLGNLRGITINGETLNEYGIYIKGGIFQNNTIYTADGNTIEQKFSTLNGQLDLSMSTIKNNMSLEKGNILKNSGFGTDTNYWNQTTIAHWINVNGSYLYMSGYFYIEKNSIADIYNDNGRNVLRILNTTITQTHDCLNILAHDPVSTTGTYTYSYAIFCKVLRAGTLKIGFNGTDLYEEKQLEVGKDYIKLSKVAQWDETGDFIISFDGEILIYGVSVFQDALADATLHYESSLIIAVDSLTSNYKKYYTDEFGVVQQSWESQFQQQADQISAYVTEINNITNTINTSGWITEATGNSLWSKTTVVDALTNRVSTAESDITQNSTSITQKVSTTDYNGQTIISKVNQTSTSYTIDASHIFLTGAVTFSMFNSSVQSIINEKVSSSSLGSVAYQNAVSLAMLDTSVIQGGYIKTSLLDVNTIFAKQATIGNFSISNGSLVSDIFSLHPSTGLLFKSGSRQAALGIEAGNITSGVSALLFVGDSDTSTTEGLRINFSPSNTNRALQVYGNIRSYGGVSHFQKIVENDPMIGYVGYRSAFAFYNHGTTLPSLETMAEVYGDQGVFIEYTIICTGYSTADMSVVLYQGNTAWYNPDGGLITWMQMAPRNCIKVAYYNAAWYLTYASSGCTIH